MVIQLIEYVVKKLVDKPEVVTVTEVDVAGKTVIKVRVSAADIGKVIGSEGRTFRALRMLMGVVSADKNKDLVIDTTE